MSHPQIVKYITEQLTDAGEVTARKMFGDYTLYCNGKVVGMICDDELYLKPLEVTRTFLRDILLKSPYPGAKPYYVISDIDDRDYITMLVRTTTDNL